MRRAEAALSTLPAPAPEAQAVEALRRELDAKQAQIDELMLEYCPDEMTPEQLAEYERHQVSVDAGKPIHKLGDLSVPAPAAQGAAQQAPAVPPGYALVPVGPTPEMMQAAFAISVGEPDWLWKRYQAMLAAAPQPPAAGWQPIETAPKDGTPILAISSRGLASTVCWSPTWGEFVDWPSGKTHNMRPTHWMPLPAAPQAPAAPSESNGS